MPGPVSRPPGRVIADFGAAGSTSRRNALFAQYQKKPPDFGRQLQFPLRLILNRPVLGRILDMVLLAAV